jgi:hypothetical protein
VDHLSIAPEKPAQLFRRPPLKPNDQVRALNYDDLGRRRLTVFFRFFMAIPHFLWLSIWAAGMTLLAPVLWVITLFKGRPPDGLRDVYAMFVRYGMHVYAFTMLAAHPFPGFLGRPRTYPVEVEVPPNGDQSRWSVGFRLVLALPPLILATALAGFGGGGSSDPTATSDPSDPTGSSPGWETLALSFGGVTWTAAFLAWFACMARSRMPQGMRDLIVWALGYTAQVYAYLFLLTHRYPNSDPAVAPLAPVPPHPIRLRLTDELRRNRWTVAFRFILAMPHFVWATLWGVVAVLAAIPAWLATLVLGRLPSGLHRFLSAYVRYQAHVLAFAYLGGGPFPGFVGAPGTYPVDVEIEAPERQNRWTVAFRLLLGFPALLLASAVGGAAVFAAIGGWFAALFTGRMPQGLRNVIAFSARYSAQVYGYVLLVTPRYPYSGPGDWHR